MLEIIIRKVSKKHEKFIFMGDFNMSDSNGIRAHNHVVYKQHSTI